MSRSFHLLYDLITPDGYISSIDYETRKAVIDIENIPSHFVGFDIDQTAVFFNVKSTLAQLGIHAETEHIELCRQKRTVRVHIHFFPTDPIGAELISMLQIGSHVGRLFAMDDRRRVREPYYLERMFGRIDINGDHLLSFGKHEDERQFQLEKDNGRVVAKLPLLDGTWGYDERIFSLLPTISEALKLNRFRLREMIKIYQKHSPNLPRQFVPGEQLLVKTMPLHIRSVFARVVDEHLPSGYTHTAASILEPTTKASGDIYELFGNSDQQIDTIPLEFYTLEPYKEHVFFADRDQLQASLENPQTLFNAFETGPEPREMKAATFVVKGDQLLNLKPEDWIGQDSEQKEYPGIFDIDMQADLVERYISLQPAYPFLKAIEDGDITSQGILLCRYLPTPVLKRMLLSDLVAPFVKAIYFEQPSQKHGDFFSQEDRATLLDLAKFGVPVYWVDKQTQNVLLYVPKGDKDAGLFVPPEKAREFSSATVFGVYGSNLLEYDLAGELERLLRGLLDLKETSDHPLFNPETPITLVTGGGPGAMRVGNEAAKKAGILSCANICEFSGLTVNEQKQNPFVEAKMTYRLEKLVERQAEFNLHFPIILIGGIGTDFEYSLEEVRRKTGVTDPTPVLLFGPKEYWKEKISARQKCNDKYGTIKGSEWVSNCFFCVENAIDALAIYRDYFSGKLVTGPKGPSYPDGFVHN